MSEGNGGELPPDQHDSFRDGPHAPAPMEEIGEAPKGVLLDTPEHIARFAGAIRMQAVLTHAMPPNNFSGMTDDERAVLARWLKLETAQN